LVLEELRGGELWELVGNPKNRERMGLIDPSEIRVESLDGCGDGCGEGFVRRLIGELCRGVGWLHKVGVVHRDIKLESKLTSFTAFAYIVKADQT